MTRSPLAYPLNRSADSDVGGAADLQTDIMRFMAILSLCLVAIFALVQSIPLTPVEPAPLEKPVPATIQAIPETPAPKILEAEAPASKAQPARVAETREIPLAGTVTLTRPKWVPRHEPKPARVADAAAVQALPDTKPPAPEPVQEPIREPEPTASAERDGFTLRFESDAALTRAVAASHVGLYALESDRAQRMTVSNSRISFWDASTPNTFHEMEAATVPAAVIDALERTGSRAGAVSWGVTLPGSMKSQLDALMQAHNGGTLIIGARGDIHWEAS